MIIQSVLKLLHTYVGRAVIGEIRDFMETDKIHPALQAAQQADQSIGVPLTVVPSGEHSVLEAHPALPCKVILPDQADYIFQRPGFLDGHHLEAFFGERIMKAHRQMAAFLVKECFQYRQDADSAEGYAFRAPAEPLGRGKDAYGLADLGVIVQRLPHPHKYGVCKRFALRDTDKLVKDVRGIQIAPPSLAAGHTETAAHTAAHLGAHAEGAPLLVGNHDGFYGFFFVDGKKVLGCAVTGGHRSNGSRGPELAVFLQARLRQLGYVGHGIPAGNPLYIQPLGELTPHKGLQSAICGEGRQLRRTFSEQLCFHITKITNFLLYLYS